MDSTAAVDDINAALRQAKNIFERRAAIPANFNTRMNTANQANFFQLHQASFAAIVAQITAEYPKL